MKTAKVIFASLLIALLLTGFALAGSGYTAGLDCESPEALIGNSVTVSVSVGHASDSVFSSAELILSYDSTRLSFVSLSGTGSGASVDSGTAGTLIIEDCGSDKSLGDGAYTLIFSCAASGDAAVTLDAAAFSSKEHAETGDLIPAQIDASEQSVTISVLTTYSVTLPEEDYVSGEDSVGEGQDYTLEVDEYEHYDYEVSATMGGEPAEVQDNGDGTYTVKNVTGALIFEVSRTGKQYDVSFQTESDVELPEDTTATYGEDFRFPLPKREGYATTLTVTLEDGTEVPYSEKDGVVTIAGDRIVGKLKISIEQTELPPAPTPTPTPGDDKGRTNARTGDSARPLLWIGILLVGGLGITLLVKRRKTE